MSKIRELRWTTGTVLPEKIGHDTLSAREKEYFMNYSKLMGDYNEAIELDLTTDIEVTFDIECYASIH